MKRCSRCGALKLLGAFHLRRGSPDGHRNDCRVCALARMRRRGVTDGDRRRKRAAYLANREDVVLARRDYREREGAAINARRRDLRSANPERYREQKRAWLRRNPEKASAQAIRTRARRRLEHHLDADAARYVQTVRRDPCSYCGGPGGTWDHIVPVARGGSSEPENATGACARCNASKKDDTMLHFLLRVPTPKAA